MQALSKRNLSVITAVRLNKVALCPPASPYRFFPAMGPPKKGTLAYTKYLVKQTNRRKKLRKAQKSSNRAEEAQSFVAEALREAQHRWQAEVDTQVLQKNQKLRENSSLLKRCNVLAKDYEKVKEALHNEKVKNKELNDQLVEATTKFEQTLRSLRRWDLWWAWVAAKASPQLLAHLGRLGRSPPKSSGDRCWGGGQ